ncbi:MAG TPA: hypothetical protein VF883_11795 [Thermoanaerobaculia bacterium]|jgi:hypothetical protein
MAKSERTTHSEREEQERLPAQSFVAGRFRRHLAARRSVTLDLPEFLLYALEARVSEANVDEPAENQSTLSDYIETELVNLITLRDVAELDMSAPGFAEAVQSWLNDMR